MQHWLQSRSETGRLSNQLVTILTDLNSTQLYATPIPTSFYLTSRNPTFSIATNRAIHMIRLLPITYVARRKVMFLVVVVCLSVHGWGSLLYDALRQTGRLLRPPPTRCKEQVGDPHTLDQDRWLWGDMWTEK